jgi:fatty-acid desaturase
MITALTRIVPVQIFGVYALYLLFTGQYSWWNILCIVIGYICIMILGVSGCYHRMLSHKSFSVHPLIKKLMLWCSAISNQGSPIFWVMIHRGYHHKYSDTDKDPHSPIHGFWHSYILWMFKLKEGDHNIKYVVDLLKDKDVLFFHKYYNWIIWVSHFTLAIINFEFWLFTIMLPAFLTLHSFAIQTSLNHSKKYGYRNYETKDDSVNVIWLWPLILGEAWHNNHHGESGEPNFGGRKWWEIDPTYQVIKLIRSS